MLKLIKWMVSITLSIMFLDGLVLIGVFLLSTSKISIFDEAITDERSSITNLGKIIDVKSNISSCTCWLPGLISHRYSVIFSADSEIFAFSAMFRAEPVDFFDISGHNWFSDEHFWTSLIQRWTLLAGSKQAKTMKKRQNKWFFSQYWCWRDEKLKISE